MTARPNPLPLPDTPGDPWPEDDHEPHRSFQTVAVVRATLHDLARPPGSLADGPSRMAAGQVPNLGRPDMHHPHRAGWTTLRLRTLIPDSDREPLAVRCAVFNLPRYLADWLMVHVRAYAMTSRVDMDQVVEIAHVGVTTWWRDPATGDPLCMDLPRVRVAAVSTNLNHGDLYGYLTPGADLYQVGDAPKLYRWWRLSNSDHLPPGL